MSNYEVQFIKRLMNLNSSNISPFNALYLIYIFSHYYKCMFHLHFINADFAIIPVIIWTLGIVLATAALITLIKRGSHGKGRLSQYCYVNLHISDIISQSK